MAAKAEVTSIEACGITVEVDVSKLNDARFMLAISKVSDDKVPDGEKLVWYSRVLDLLFDGSAYEVVCRLADANGGSCDNEMFAEFVKQVMEEAGAKN